MKLKRLIPNKIKTRYAIYKETNKLRKLPTRPFFLDNLRCFSQEDLLEVFNSNNISSQWGELASLRDQLKLPNLKGGINAGDQRAIYHIIKAMNAKKVLEIGTHIGASAAHICLALKDQEEARFVTVDIKDVNNQKKNLGWPSIPNIHQKN